jgi:hypothetical protein
MEQKPWRVGIGVLVGLIVGIAIWWSAFEPRMGIFQQPQLIVVPAALGVLIVILRNKRRATGHLDTDAQGGKQDDRL